MNDQMVAPTAEEIKAATLRARVRIDHTILEHLRLGGFAERSISTFGILLKTGEISLYGVVLGMSNCIEGVADELGIWTDDEVQPFIGVLEHGLFVAKLSERPETRVLEYCPLGVLV